MPKQPRKPSIGTRSREKPALDRLTELISRSQQGYRALIDHLDLALFTLSLQGEIRVANLLLSQVLDASFQDLIGHKLTDFVEAPSALELERALPQLLRSGSWSGTVPVRLKRESELRYVSCWLQVVADKEGSKSIAGWARDITAQRESEIRFAELFESLREGIVFSTPAGRILDANPALVRMLGFDTKEELLRQNFSDLYDDPAERQKLIRLLGEKGSMQNAEFVLRRRDGRKIYCVTSGFAIRDASGKAVRLQGIITDVSERREIERKLHREQEFGRQLIECFPDLIAVMDREGRFTYVSDRAREILGVTPERYLGRRIGSSTHPDDRAPLLRMVREIVEGRSNYSQIESRVRRADGEWRILRTSASPMFDEEGRITGVVASVRDMTEAHATEQQNLQKEKFAAMGQMMAGAAHELNNPLTAILGVSDLLRERAADDATRRQIDLILQQARRAAAIIQNLLAFSRPAVQGRAKLRLDDVLREAIAAQSAPLASKNITVKFSPPADLPLVEGDRRLLSQIFANLITNAQQSISSARDRGKIEVSLQNANGRVCATIADDGPGIPPENRSKIFDPFFTTKRPGGGSGLGLTIALAVVKDHGGTIDLAATPDGGASFHVYLPAVASEPKQPEMAAPVVKAAPSAADALAGHSVLIVEDEEGIREIVFEGLSARGMKVHAVSSAEEALAYLASHACDVVICDFNLPGLSGDKLYEQYASTRDGARPPQFVFMTGDLADSETFDRLRAQGASILQKPFHIGALTALLTESLQPQPS